MCIILSPFDPFCRESQAVMVLLGKMWVMSEHGVYPHWMLMGRNGSSDMFIFNSFDEHFFSLLPTGRGRHPRGPWSARSKSKSWLRMVQYIIYPGWRINQLLPSLACQWDAPFPFVAQGDSAPLAVVAELSALSAPPLSTAISSLTVTQRSGRPAAP